MIWLELLASTLAGTFRGTKGELRLQALMY